MKELERITGVALKTLDGDVVALPAPKRHPDLFALMAFMRYDYKDMDPGQGFMTSHGRYVTRKEALFIAVAAKQLIGPTNSTIGLFSEDVW